MSYLVAQIADMKFLRFKLWLEVAVQVEIQIGVCSEKPKKWEKRQEQLDIKTVLQGETMNRVCCRDKCLISLWLIFNVGGLQLPDKITETSLSDHTSVSYLYSGH